MKIDKKSMIILILIVLMIILIIIKIPSTNNSSENNLQQNNIQYSKYDYLKDKINEYNDVYSISSGNAGSSILMVEDETNIILMLTIFGTSKKDVALIDFTNMKIQNTSYNKYGNATLKTEMSIDKNYNILSASTYLYSQDRFKSYEKYNSEWQTIQRMATGIGNGIDAIIKGNDGKGIDVFNKTVQDLKNSEHI